MLSAKVSGVQDLMMYRLWRLDPICAAPRSHRSGDGAARRCLQHGRSRCCCRKASATRFASAYTAAGRRSREEVFTCQDVLQSLGIRSFTPQVTACPGCGRTTSTVFQEMACDIQDHLSARMSAWKSEYPGIEQLKVADGLRRERSRRIQACQHRNLTAGNGEEPKAPVY